MLCSISSLISLSSLQKQLKISRPNKIFFGYNSKIANLFCETIYSILNFKKPKFMSAKFNKDALGS